MLNLNTGEFYKKKIRNNIGICKKKLELKLIYVYRNNTFTLLNLTFMRLIFMYLKELTMY